ncbi:Protein Wnt-6 [Halocaridina rubra]|uniref:Protein Wnt n=1 Tax=Halocaridina rubra TaxID=373956 RepID=A0AAN9A4Z5_HALRR
MDHSRICRKSGRKEDNYPLITICRKEPELVRLIQTGSKIALLECQHQFKNHRWNCTSNKKSLKRILMRDTPETAFLNSIMSAAITHEVTAACTRGDLLQCSCSKNAYETDPIDYSRRRPKNKRKHAKEIRAVISAYTPATSGRSSDLFSEEGRGEHRKGKKRRGRKGRRRKLTREEKQRRRLQRLRDNNIASIGQVGALPERPRLEGHRIPVVNPLDGSKMTGGHGAPSTIGVIGQDWHWSGCDDNVAFGYKIARDFMDGKYLRGRGSPDIKSLVMLRNNEAGRLAVRNHLRPHCKCHGLSGSCTNRTCWKRMPTLRHIGQHLKQKYRNAVKVIPNNDGISFMTANISLKPPLEEDLVYLEDSPDFCSFNRRTGSLGTAGRRCNSTGLEESGCESLCCGRPYRSEIKMETETCHCRFKFCCEVTCQKCQVRREYSYCT